MASQNKIVSAISILYALAMLTACGGRIALPKTGQTTCYDATGVVIDCAGTGQDGELQTGVAAPDPRFTAGTGTTAACITDNLTGLMWTQNANLPAAALTWQQALEYTKNLNLCGFSDWRLPNRKELRSLVNYNVADSADTLLALGFSNVQVDNWALPNYWSSSSYNGKSHFGYEATGSFPGYAANAWLAGVNGGLKVVNKASSYYVWPVRAGQ